MEWKTWDTYDDLRDVEREKKRLEEEGYETDVVEAGGIYLLFYRDKVSDRCKECISLLSHTAYTLGALDEAVHNERFIDAESALSELKSNLASMNVRECISPRVYSNLENVIERLQKEIEKGKVPAGSQDFVKMLEREILQFIPDDVLGRACFGRKRDDDKSYKKAIQEYPALLSEEREELMRIANELGLD